MRFALPGRPGSPVPAVALDVALVVGAAVFTAYRVRAGSGQPGDRLPDGAAYGLGLIMSVLLLARRRWPGGVLALLALLWVVYHTRDYPGGAPAVPMWIGLYSVAVAPRRTIGLLVAAVLVVCDALARTGPAGASLFDAELDGSTVVFGAVLLLGDSVRSRRAWLAEARARTALLLTDRERTIDHRLAEERIRIARELHDITAHTIAVIGVQAQVAAETLGEDPEQARGALREVRRATREAMGELRAAVGVLHDGARPASEDTAPVDPDRLVVAPPVPGLDGLAGLATTARAAGRVVRLRQEGTERTVPRAVQAVAFRIAQESVTNVLRHSDAAGLDIVLSYAADGIALEVTDDGRSAPAPETRPTPGFGLRGMAERAASLGGSLTAGPLPDRGFRVRAWLPIGTPP